MAAREQTNAPIGYQVVESSTRRPLSVIYRDERCAYMEAACWTGAVVIDVYEKKPAVARQGRLL